MNDLIKLQWLTALRSGVYKQCKGVLRDEDGNFCCLGVLTDLYCAGNNEKWVESSADFSYYLQGDNEKEDAVLPDVVVGWSGIVTHNPIVNDEPIAELNDIGYSFEQLAELIDEQL